MPVTLAFISIFLKICRRERKTGKSFLLFSVKLRDIDESPFTLVWEGPVFYGLVLEFYYILIHFQNNFLQRKLFFMCARYG